MSTRTDIHCPKNIVPADYTFVGLMHQKIDSLGMVYAVLAERARIEAHMKQTGGTYSKHQHGGNCHICGAACIYTALFYHAKTNSYIRTGMDCAEKLDMGDRSRFKVFRDAINAARHHQTGKKKAEGVLLAKGLEAAWKIYAEANDPQDTLLRAIMEQPHSAELRLVYADYLEEQGEGEKARFYRRTADNWGAETYSAHTLPFEERTIADIVGKLVQYGSISEKQESFVRSLLIKIADRPNAERLRQEREAAKAFLPDVPEGRQTFRGVVVKVDYKENNFGGYRGQFETVKKITVKSEAGWLVWGTCPSGAADAEKGDTVEMTATLERGGRDPKFGFMKRPSGKIMARAEQAQTA